MQLRKWWKEQLKSRINECGIPLSEVNNKRGKDTRSPTELHREMLSKAAVRLAQIHTKQKQQEVERQNREAADAELRKLETDPKYGIALNRLNRFFENRSPRVRQTEQWDRVVREWGKLETSAKQATDEARIQAAKRLQDELRDEKFGDINLFLALADEDFKTVWWHNGKTNPTMLKTYVKGSKARADADRLKVASYRHPDLYNNPVFCQFGVSRPHIRFRRVAPIKSKNAAAQDVRSVEMLLWDGRQTSHRILLAASKRFDREIGSACDAEVENTANVPLVSRRSRLGLCTLPDPELQKPRVAAVFDQKEVKSRNDGTNLDEEARLKEMSWNGTLFADRRTLKRLGVKSNANGNPAHDALHWWLIVSLELQPQGPWYDFVSDAVDKTPFQRTVRKNEETGKKRKKGTKYISWDGWPHEELNKPLKESKTGTLAADSSTERKGHAALILSRLPGVRVLSVDLGHRFAAACAVWETLSQADFETQCAEAKSKGWQVEVHDLYATIKQLEQEANNVSKKAREEGRVKKFRPTTFYRRIGADKRADDLAQPAPWRGSTGNS